MNHLLILEKLQEKTDSELQVLAASGAPGVASVVAIMAARVLEHRKFKRELWSDLLIDSETDAALRQIGA